MENFEEVSADIIKAVADINYDDSKKKVVQSQILYNLYHLLKSEEFYESSIKTLMQKEKKQKLNLVLNNNEH